MNGSTQSTAGTKRFVLRLDPEIHDAVARWAAEEHRSMNKQIAYVLRRALVDRSRRRNLQSVGSPD